MLNSVLLWKKPILSGLSRLKPKKEFELIVPQDFSARSQNYVPAKLGNPKPVSQSQDNDALQKLFYDHVEGVEQYEVKRHPYNHESS